MSYYSLFSLNILILNIPCHLQVIIIFQTEFLVKVKHQVLLFVFGTDISFVDLTLELTEKSKIDEIDLIYNFTFSFIRTGATFNDITTLYWPFLFNKW